MGVLFEEDSFGVFVLVTVLLGGGAAGAASLPPSRYAARTSGRSKSSRPVPVSVMTPLTMT